MEKSELVLVTGAGGFVGGHLVAEHRSRGFESIRAVDIKPFEDWLQFFPDVDNRRLDLREKAACYEAVDGAVYVFNLASEMGGSGFIELNKGACMLSVLINAHMLMAAQDCAVQRFFYSSSVYVYAADKQTARDVVALKESDAYPAMAVDGYGWEKLFSERMCQHFLEDFGVTTRVVRYHNVFGPNGSDDGGREKVPAAICRKVIQAKLSGSDEIEIWGDGEQKRSFMYIDDCLEGTLRVMESDVTEPLNLGSDQLVTINQLVDIVEAIAGAKLRRTYKLDAPQGVRGRNSDNTLIQQRLGWSPRISLEEGMRRTYRWIYDQVNTAIIRDSHRV